RVDVHELHMRQVCDDLLYVCYSLFFCRPLFFFFFFFTDPATTEIYTLSLHDALPILRFAVDECLAALGVERDVRNLKRAAEQLRSEEHTSELQSQSNLVCRLLLEKKKKKTNTPQL